MSDETENETKALTVTAEMVDKAIVHVSEGKSLASIARTFGVKRQTLSAAIRREEALERYEEARREGASALAEEIVGIADEEKDPQKARNRIDARKWLASKHLPRVYGEKIDLNVNQTVDIIGAIKEARARVQRIDADVVDAEIVEREKLPAPKKDDLFS